MINWRQRLVALTGSWEGLNETEVRRITQGDCKRWAGNYARKASPTNYNNTVALLRQVLSCAADAGVIYANPASGLKRVTIRSKEIALPSTDKFNALIAEMRNGHGRDSRNCADFAAGLAFTGCRLSEANALEWRDIDINAGEIVVRGDADTGTKKLGAATPKIKYPGSNATRSTAVLRRQPRAVRTAEHCAPSGERDFVLKTLSENNPLLSTPTAGVNNEARVVWISP